MDELKDPESDVHGEIARLARELSATQNTVGGPEAALEAVTQMAVSVLPAVDHAGITLVGGPGQPARRLRSTAETGSVAKQFDMFQHETGDGPCFRAIREEVTVSIPDVDTETRWPRLMNAVRQNLPIKSCLSMQLFVADHELGALNMHSDTAHAFTPEVCSVAEVLATHAAIALSNARRGQQFRSALATRDLIGQAKGMLMERYGVDAVRAFDILRQLSQESNTPVTRIAEQVVEAR